MSRKLLITITMLAALLLSKEGHAQDPEFSQFYANPLYLNPALAGANICPRIILNYRNQWPGLEKSFVTYNASYDQHIEKISGGVGAIVNVDNAGNGILRTSQISLMYAYHLQAGEEFTMNMAVQGTFYQRALNWDLLVFGDQIDPQGNILPSSSEVPPDNSSIMFPDFSAGLAFGWKGMMYGGVAAHHLTQPNMAFYLNNNDKLPLKLTGHLGMNINLEGGGASFTGEDEPKFYLSPNILYQQQGDFHQLNAGLYVTRLPIIIGTWFRHNFENVDAVIVLAGLNHKNLRVGYSYDITLSKLKSHTGGAHEVSLAWHFSCIEKRRKLRAINAPGF